MASEILSVPAVEAVFDCFDLGVAGKVRLGALSTARRYTNQ